NFAELVLSHVSLPPALQPYFLSIAERLTPSVSSPQQEQLAARIVADGFNDFLELLPNSCAQCIFTVPLIDALPNPGLAIEALVLPYFDEQIRDTLVFSKLRNILERNQTFNRERILPSNYEAEPTELVRTFLKDTPFIDLFSLPIPFSIP